MAVTTSIILAGGRGERFWPYSTVRNKCAAPVCNVPNVRRLVDSLVECGVTRVVVVVAYRAGSVQAALAGSTAQISFVTADAEGGTAGALLAGSAGLPDERLLVIYGDTATTTDSLRRFLASWELGDTPGAVMWDPMPGGEGSLWHGVETDGEAVRGIVGHNSDSTKRMSGVFGVDRSILPVIGANRGYMRAPIGGMPPMEPDLAQSLNDWNEPINAIEAADFVFDLDKPWHLLEANRRLADHLCGQLSESVIDPSARVDEGAEIVGPIRVGPDAVIGKRVVISGPAIVGGETRIINGAILEGANVVGAQSRISDYCLLGRGSIVGDGCVLGHGAEMDGVMMDGSYLWHYCEISGVVGLSVDIGAATVCGTLRFDDRPAEHNVRGRRERPSSGANATYFGDFCRTGVNVITMPGAKIGSYSCVGAGIVVYGEVPERTLRVLKQETVDRAWGPKRYGW